MNATNYFTAHRRSLSRLGGLLAAALLALPPVCARAGERQPAPATFAMLKVGDEDWKNARVVKATSLELVINHDGGGATLKRAELPVELAVRYPFDAAEAATFERERSAVRARDAVLQLAAASAVVAQKTIHLQAMLAQRAVRLQTVLDSANDDLVQMGREVPILAAKARGRRANSPERLELDAARNKQLGHIRQVRLLQLELKQLRTRQTQSR